MVPLVFNLHWENVVPVEWEVAQGHDHDRPAGQAHQVPHPTGQEQGGVDDGKAGWTISIQ